MIDLNLFILIVIWWVGAITAGLALVIPIYSNYFIVGATGWIIVSVATGLILYQIKAHGKKKEVAERG